MRVIAGTYRSRQLKSLDTPNLRPTSDRLRETLFNVLSPRIRGAHFLDLFAGTGAIGIEALSRGAQDVLFVENHPPAAKLIRENLTSLKILNGATVLSMDAHRALEKLQKHQLQQSSSFAYDFIFLDPPYAAADEYLRIMNFLSAAPFVSASTVVIAEHTRKFELPEEFPPVERVRVLKQGDAVLSFYRQRPPSAEVPGIPRPPV
ncbi:MAG: 16S rRNA (guanine(966)-N(2))-methyltransferase RsmD [Candidatus Acidiferrum sp.]|jgi:16S rRNA (guanine(966)-N(2))-methyltransferase RsmD